jgi:hypothetical protein
MDKRVETGREFWRAVLLADGATAIPRWTHDPAPGVAEHVATVDDDLAAAGVKAGRCAGPAAALGGAGPAREVLAALSGEQDMVAGYAAGPGGRPAKLAIALNRAVSLNDIAEHPMLADMAELLHRAHAPELLIASSGGN